MSAFDTQGLGPDFRMLYRNYVPPQVHRSSHHTEKRENGVGVTVSSEGDSESTHDPNPSHTDSGAPRATTA